MVSFAAIDFETATASRDSACAIGIAVVDDGNVTVKRSWLIKPPNNEYDDFNISIHGITPEHTLTALSFDRVWPEVLEHIGERVVIAHNTAFDISVVRKSAALYDLPLSELRFACTYRMAKSTWPNRWNYRLDSLASELGITLDHHDPQSDAAAAAALGLILCRENHSNSIEELAIGLEYRLGHLVGDEHQGFSNAAASGAASLTSLKATVENMDEHHSLFGTRVVFTGTLESMTRRDAAQAAVNVGARVGGNISATTDYLVVGMTDFSRVGLDGMSSKLRKAFQLATSGLKLEIIDENEFLALLGDPG